MSTAQPILWYQGMFLQPQHFQLSEQWQKHQVDAIRQQLIPFAWGFETLSIAQSAINARNVELYELDAQFQDGTHVVLNDNAVIFPRSLDGIEIDPEQPTTLYIAIKKQSQFEENVTTIQNSSEAKDVKTRYFSLVTPTQIKDHYQASEPADAKLLTLKLDIVLETEAAKYSDYHLMPFARIQLDGDQLVYDTQYIPPVLNIGGYHKLQALVKDVKDELAGRAVQLSSSHNMMASVVDSNLLRLRMGLQALSRFVPRLQHETDAAQLHPWHLYGSLRELIGEISMFSNDVNFLGEADDGTKLLPNYTHLNIGECFHSARQLVNQLLNEISVGPQFMVELAKHEEQFSADIPEDFFSDRADFYLVLNTQSEWSDYDRSFFTEAKLASPSTLDVLVERALPGIGLMHMPSAPAGLPKKANANYVRIDVHDDEWQTVKQQQQMKLFWDQAPTDLVIELVILKR